MRSPLETTPRAGTDRPPWLSARAAEWIAVNPGLLEHIYAEFDRTGEWPDPVQLQRTLRARGIRQAVASAANNIPGELGGRDYNPSEVRLNLMGLAAVPAARPLLELYVGLLDLALKRHDQPKLPNRLTRQDVETQLGLTRQQADRFSKLILRDGVFLAGGEANLESWNLDIHEQVVDFEEIEDVEGFLTLLAERRGWTREPVAVAPDPSLYAHLTRSGRLFRPLPEHAPVPPPTPGPVAERWLDLKRAGTALAVGVSFLSGVFAITGLQPTFSTTAGATAGAVAGAVMQGLRRPLSATITTALLAGAAVFGALAGTF